MQTTLGYWRSQVLFSAVGLGVFDALAEGPLSGPDLAERIGAAPGHTTRLLNACVALEFLEKQDGEFRNAPIAERHLVAGGPEYMGNWVRFMSGYYEPWGGMQDAVRNGKPIPARPERTRPEYAREMVLAMHDHAVGPGRAAVQRLALDGRRRLLDVGGGAGSFSIMLAERHPELEAVVYDLPPVVDVAREVIDRYGLSARVTTQQGSYLEDDLGSGYDVVLLSNMLHQEDPDTCRRILRKAHAALDDDGLLVIQLSFLNETKDGPPWAVLQSLQLLLFYEGGQAYSIDDVLEMLPGAGFTNPEVKASLVTSESLILATKGPAA